jgi:hypothetical protein
MYGCHTALGCGGLPLLLDHNLSSNENEVNKEFVVTR